MNGRLDKHLLAGLDDRERGFSRSVEFEQAGEGYRAVLRYEAVRVRTEPHPTQDVALLTLIQTLQAQGYRQLKSQRNFQDGLYLGSQELWVEYTDPPEAGWRPSGLIAKLLNWFHARVTNQ